MAQNTPVMTNSVTYIGVVTQRQPTSFSAEKCLKGWFATLTNSDELLKYLHFKWSEYK